MEALELYVRYAFRSFLRGRSRSVFGAFCVAVGIASVVALGLAGGNFRNTITADAQKQTRGDVSASPAGLGFTVKQSRIFEELKARGQILDYTARLQDDAALRNPIDTGVSAVGYMTAVDPAKFPFYDRIVADTPTGVPLRTLLSNPETAVVSHDAMDTLHLNVGDKIRVESRRGFTHEFTITGVVPDNAPDPSFGSGFWNDFLMVNRSAVLPFFHGLDVGANIVYMKTRDAARATAVKKYLEKSLGGFPLVKTAADTAKDSENSANGFDQFFRIMGLVAVVIGGIGIINTMLVAARRRTREIAVLKSMGMKGRQVVLIFTVEALLLALCGTAVGLLLGIVGSMIVTSVTANLAGFAIPWSLQAEPLIAGALVGIVATVLFSYLPILGASRARPIAALRGDGMDSWKRHSVRKFAHNMRTRPVHTMLGVRHAPMGFVRLWKRQKVRTFLMTLVVAVLMGYLAVLYTGMAAGIAAVRTGILLGLGVLVGAAVITQIFIAIVWVVSKLPTFGRISLRMAFRSMGSQKRRLASTLLALCIGMLSVGSIAIVAQNLKSSVSNAVTHQLHVKAIVQTPFNPAVIHRLNAEVARLPGISSASFGSVANGAQLLKVDGRDANALLQQAIRAKTVSRDEVVQIVSDMRGIEGRDLSRGQYPLNMKTGRNLRSSDVGTDAIVVDSLMAKSLGARLHSTLTFVDGARRVTFHIVGVYDSQGSFAVMAQNEADARYMRSAGMATPSSSHLSLLALDMRDDVTQANLSRIRRDVKGVLVLDLGAFLSNFTKALDKLTLFPEVIAGLALFAGVIIIANTVALAMLERRREIGVIKAVGARRRNILQFLLVENAIVGFVGAGAGVLLAMVATAIFDGLLFKISPSFDPLTIVSLLGLGMLLAMGASAVTALPASSEKPMTVLRYE